jgi:putative effector of murein hydrolase
MVGEIKFWTWVVLFLIYFVFDILYAKYIIAVSKRNALLAANTSVLILVLSVYGTVSYIDSYINIIPIVVGCWCGTFFCLKWKRKKDVA